MAISRITAVWTGFSGAPGYTNFYFDAFGGGDLVDDEAARVQSFFGSVRGLLTSSISIQVQSEAAIIDETTGELIDYAQLTTPASPITGSTSGAYSAPTGAAITWNTQTIARGRRLRGRTFLVPLAGGAYESDGTLAPATVADLQDAASDLIGDGTGPQAVIWSRPRNGTGGTIGPITSYRVADQAAVLRSRRD